MQKNEKIYIQVCREVTNEKTEKREYDNILSINDNYPKYLLRKDFLVYIVKEAIKEESKII